MIAIPRKAHLGTVVDVSSAGRVDGGFVAGGRAEEVVLGPSHREMISASRWVRTIGRPERGSTATDLLLTA
jgi:hypothetical protein